MTGAGCFSRVLGPIFISFVYTRFGTYYTFGFIACVMVACMIWLSIVRDKLVPPTFGKQDVEMVEILSDKLKQQKTEDDDNTNNIKSKTNELNNVPDDNYEKR